MVQEETQAPIRLQPLIDVVEDAERGEIRKLLDFCIEEDIPAYTAVPAGHVAVLYRYVVMQELRSLFATEKPAVIHPGRPMVDRSIKYLQLDPSDLRALRDGGIVKVEGFHHGGLGGGRNGLFPTPFKYCAIRKDAPNPFISPGVPEALLPKQVYPVATEIRLADVLLTLQDAKAARQSVLAVEDKWGHELAAPSVFLAYRAAHLDYHFENAKTWLIDHDKNNVFTATIAKTIAFLLNPDVRRDAQEGLALEKIENNETGNNYADPRLSARMSLLLLATDCWIHDTALDVEIERRIGAERDRVSEVRSDPRLSAKQREMIDEKMVEFDYSQRKLSGQKKYMKRGLDKYLEKLGFNAKSNQVRHLVNVITNKKSPRHASTKRNAAAIRRNGAGRRS